MQAAGEVCSLCKVYLCKLWGRVIVKWRCQSQSSKTSSPFHPTESWSASRKILKSYTLSNLATLYSSKFLCLCILSIMWHTLLSWAACFVTLMEHPVYYVTVCHTLYVLSSLFCRLDGTPCILCDTPCMCLAACFVAWMESSPLRRDTWTQHGEGRCCHCRGVVPSCIMEEHVFGAFVHIQIFAISGVPKKS